jgi:Rho guanine nucleotide exchange factor 12
VTVYGPCLTHQTGRLQFDSFECYKTFCGNTGRALNRLRDLQLTDAELEMFLQACQQNPACHRLSLKDFLPMAMQRLTRYPLLLETILGCTPKSHEEHADLLAASKKVKEVVTLVNEHVKRCEMRETLARLQDTIDMSLLTKVSE